jgi:3-hydroxybutyryl-CoA dehydrogenase
MNGNRVAVVGLGLLGRGIAACFLARGFEVVAVDTSEARLRESIAAIDQSMAELTERGGLNPERRASWREHYHPTVNYSHLRGCSFVVESIAENLQAKQAVLSQIEEVTADSRTVVASNTSAIPITLLQQPCAHPQRIIGMHWAEPAHATRFIEIIRGDRTGDEAVETAIAIAKRLGKDPSLVQKDAPGFIVNRIAYAMYREAMQILEEGIADVETIDRSLRNTLGLWASVCGPFRWMDLTGGPELYARAMAPVMSSLSSSNQLPPPIACLAEEGAKGIANGRGFYTYTTEEKSYWEQLYREQAWKVTQQQQENFPLETPHE